MLNLKLQYFGHLMQRADCLEKTLMLGKIEGKRRSGWQRMRYLDGTTDSMDMSLSKLQETVKCCSPWGCKELDMTEQLNTTTTTLELRQDVKCDKPQQSAEEQFQNLDWHLEMPASRDALYGGKKKTPGVEILEKPTGGFWGTEITSEWNRDSWKGVHGFDT